MARQKKTARRSVPSSAQVKEYKIKKRKADPKRRTGTKLREGGLSFEETKEHMGLPRDTYRH